MSKKVAFPPKPSMVVPANADTWVSGGLAQADERTPGPVNAETVEIERMKRFTFDVPEHLHRRIKARCAEKGVDMADEMRRLLEQHFPSS
jgi:hypothetical protein